MALFHLLGKQLFLKQPYNVVTSLEILSKVHIKILLVMPFLLVLFCDLYFLLFA